MTDIARSTLDIIGALYRETGETKFDVMEILTQRKIKLQTQALFELDDLGFIEYHCKVADWFILFPEKLPNP